MTSNGTTSRPANRCRMGSWKASTADCVTSASTSTCSRTSARHARLSKNGGSTTTPTDRTRASTGSHQLSSQHAPIRGITGTDSPYERGQDGEHVTDNMDPTSREMFAVREFCARYDICRQTFYDELHRGRLVARKLGKKTVVLRA